MKPDDAVSFWQAQSKLMWSRVQTTSVIEAGTLTGWYKVWEDQHPYLGVAILLLGTGILFIVSLLMRRDSQYMDACERVAGDRMPSPSPPLLGLSGRRIAVALPLLLAIINVVLSFTTICFA